MSTIFEDVVILSTHQRKATIQSSIKQDLKWGIGGAVLAELVLRGKVKTNGKQRLELVEELPTEDTVLNYAVELLRVEEQSITIRKWIKQFNKKWKGIYKDINNRLVERGILSRENKDWAWKIPSKESPDQQANAKFLMRSRLRDLVLASKPHEEYDLALLYILYSASLLDTVFMKDERKLAEQRIRQMMVQTVLADPVMQDLEEVGVAVKSKRED